MKILGLAASPRKNGNTETLLDAFLKGAEKAGAKVEKIRLASLNLRPCIGCETCFEKGICRFSDDALTMHEKLLEADVVVLASPVYFYTVSTHAKLLIDRCQALWARKYILKRKEGAKNGRGVLIATGGTKGDNLFDGIKLTAKYFFDSMNKKPAASLTFSRVDEKGAIRSVPGAIEAAEKLGEKFATDPNYIQTQE